MRITGMERWDIRRTMQDVRLNFRPVYVLIAEQHECPTCGFDSFSQSGLDTNCETCDGTGHVTMWVPHEVKARIKVLDFVQLQGAGAVPPGVELGDAAVYVRVHDRDVFELVDDDVRSYVKIDGDPGSYRVFSITADGVGYEDEVRILLKKSHVEQRATGY